MTKYFTPIILALLSASLLDGCAGAPPQVAELKSESTVVQASFDDFWAHELALPSTDLTPLTTPDARDIDIYPLLNTEDIAELRTLLAPYRDGSRR